MSLKILEAVGDAVEDMNEADKAKAREWLLSAVPKAASNPGKTTGENDPVKIAAALKKLGVDFTVFSDAVQNYDSALTHLERIQAWREAAAEVGRVRVMRLVKEAEHKRQREVMEAELNDLSHRDRKLSEELADGDVSLNLMWAAATEETKSALLQTWKALSAYRAAVLLGKGREAELLASVGGPRIDRDAGNLSPDELSKLEADEAELATVIENLKSDTERFDNAVKNLTDGLFDDFWEPRI